MTTLGKRDQINPGTEYRNDLGMTATLRFTPDGGYVPGLGCQGLWYVDHHAPYFPGGSVAMAHNMRRGVAERALRGWLAQTELPPPVN